ncbi:unnamed protein product [Vicia faba]|uniref:Dof-type domain-containing protein n=1 Tax=Vicia faba TaxID=3906 RepID=A0AAV0ZIR8_VICFA|nr:unnamed protein product [Vicia faba]
MDTTQWAQGNIGLVKQMEGSKAPMIERRARPQKDQALNCPRRYWTEGGSLRNVPVGGGSRKNKRSSPSPSISQQPPTKNIIIPDLSTQSASQNPKIHQGQDLNLAYPPPNTEDNYNTISKFIELPYTTDQEKTRNSSSSPLSAMELLKTGIAAASSSSRGLNSFMPISLSDSSAMYNSTGFSLQDFKPGLNFSLEGFDNGNYGALQGMNQENPGGGGGGARMLFPVVDELNNNNNNNINNNNNNKQQQVPNSGEFEQHQQNNRSHGDSTGYWNGMLGGGSW